MTKKRGLVGCAGLLVGAILLFLLVIPYLLVGPATRFVKEQLAAQVDAEVTLGSVSVRLLRTFPNLTVVVSDVAITNRAPFEGVELARVGQVQVGLDLASLFGDQVQVNNIALIDPTITMRVTPEGQANYDIYQGESSSEPAAPYNVKLHQLRIDNLSVSYQDQAHQLHLTLTDLDTRLSGDFSDQLAALSSQTTVSSLTVSSHGLHLLKDTTWQANVDLSYNQQTGALTLSDNQIQVNDLKTAIAGTLSPTPKGDWNLDLSFRATETPFSSLLSLVPGAYQPKLKGLQTKGTIALQGTVKGPLTTDAADYLPTFDLALQVNNAGFAYPDLPSSVEHLAADMVISHPKGPYDNLVIQAKSFEIATLDSPFSGALTVSTPFSDPNLDLRAKGTLDLAALMQALPTQAQENQLIGRLIADLTLKGRVSEFKQGRPRQASGTFALQDATLTSTSLPVPLHIRSLNLALSPAVARLTNTELAWGSKSSMRLQGQLTDIIPYLMLDAGVLRGNLTLDAPYLDIRPFQGTPEAQESSEGEEPVVVPVPSNLTMQFGAAINELVTQRFTMTQAVGQIRIEDHVATLDVLSGNVLGGNVKVSGTYTATSTTHADTDFTLSVRKLGISDTLNTFTTLGEWLPALSSAKGTFDGTFRVKTRLQEDGTPVSSTFLSDGNMRIDNLTVTPKVLSQIASKLNQPQFTEFSADTTKLAYQLKNGNLEVEPMALQLGGVGATLSGKAGVLDKSLDFGLRVPVAAAKVASLLSPKLATSDKPVTVKVGIGNTYDNPKLSVGLGGVAEQARAIIAPVADKVRSQFNKRVAEAEAAGDALIAKAEDQAKTLVTEAKKAAALLKTQNKAASEKLVAKAGSNPFAKAAAVQAANASEKQTNAEASKLIAKAKAGGDRLIAKAKQEKQRLVAEARKQSEREVP